MEKNILKTEIFNQLDIEKLLKREEEIRILLLGNPNDLNLLRELAIILYHKGDYSKAIKVYKKVIEYNNDKAEGFAFLGHLFYENEEYLKAIKAFEKSLDIDPDVAFVHFLLGNAYSRAGRIMEAITSYDFAIFLDFDIYKAHIDFAEKYEKMGLLERALREYTVAYEIDPRDKKIGEKINTIKKSLEKKVI
ncbi:tetratricopeptide repeat protein [uncultured Fusobacterium sp.]|uniref:tetratricopeptide repeat protein n=1 Tax=uncultured Fusobacterium sp. TaxID=159267 RepID=UPI00261BA634|nr:tetratricopeptide repeat protein [uncultured Fusobacterium sp.]